MSRPMSFTPINARTGEEITDPRQLAASRCMTILVACSKAVAALEHNMAAHNPGQISNEMSNLVFKMMKHGAHLDADVHTLAGMLGCTLVPVDASQIGRA
jgi:hypothetical protein